MQGRDVSATPASHFICNPPFSLRLKWIAQMQKIAARPGRIQHNTTVLQKWTSVDLQISLAHSPQVAKTGVYLEKSKLLICEMWNSLPISMGIMFHCQRWFS